MYKNGKHKYKMQAFLNQNNAQFCEMRKKMFSTSYRVLAPTVRNYHC